MNFTSLNLRVHVVSGYSLLLLEFVGAIKHSNSVFTYHVF